MLKQERWWCMKGGLKSKWGSGEVGEYGGINEMNEHTYLAQNLILKKRVGN